MRRPRALQLHPSDRLRVLEQSLRSVIRFFRIVGAQEREVQAAFALATKRARRRSFLISEAKRHALMVGLGDILSTWYTDPRYQRDGSPRPLPLKGRRSLAEIAKRHLPDASCERLYRLLLGTDLVRELEDGSIVPRRRGAIVKGISAMTLERVPVMIDALLRTLIHNAQAAQQGRDGRLELYAASNVIPESLVPEFDRYTRILGEALVEQVDFWVARRTDAARNQRRRRARAQVRASVNVFASIQPAPRPNRRKYIG